MDFNMELQCHSRQLGFRASRKNKAEQEAKFKILLAAFLCCIFMVRKKPLI